MSKKEDHMFIALLFSLFLHFQEISCNAVRAGALSHPSCDRLDIRPPFKLRDKPQVSTYDSRVIVCENNHGTVSYRGGKYYVQNITYNNGKTGHLIDLLGGEIFYMWGDVHVFDARLDEEDKCSFPSSYGEVDNGYFNIFPDATLKWVHFLSCDKPMNSPLYVNNSACIGGFSSPSSSSMSFFYMLYSNNTSFEHLDPSCTIQSSLATTGDWNQNLSASDIYLNLRLGLQIPWTLENMNSWQRCASSALI